MPFGVAYPIGYNCRVIEIRQTARYRRWFERVRDREARFRILARVRRLSLGNPGDVAAVGEGASELRIDRGPGYRVYYRQTGTTAATSSPAAPGARSVATSSERSSSLAK